MKIDIRLLKDFTTAYNQMQDKYGSDMAALNGFGDEQLSYTDFIDNFVDKQTVADASIDGNANVGHKDIVSLENEMSKPHSKLLAFNKIYYELNKKYGRKVAREWLENEWNGHFYLHDAYNATEKSYCFAYDIANIVERGLFFINNFNATPPQHLTTFTDFIGEFVSWTCNRSSGAVGLPSFLIYSFYFWHKDCAENYVLRDPEYYRDQHFQEFIYRLNQPFLRGGIQSAFTNISIFDRPYLEALFGGKEYPDGTFIIDYIDEILEYQKAFMRVVSKIRMENMMTFPVLTYALLRKDGRFVDEGFAQWCCEHNMQWGDSNFFISDDVTSLSNCCRLVSDVKNLGYFNSIGGTALEVGSVKVNTINLARLAYECDTTEEYMEALSEKALLCMQALDCVRHIIERNVEKGLLPNYSLGIMHMDKQYNTIGIIGLYEALQKYGFTITDEFGNTTYTDAGLEFATDVMSVLNEAKAAFTSDKSYMVNIEQIPGERAAAVLMQKDKLLFPNEAYELPLYGNQWIPLGVKSTLYEKIRLSAILDKACNGGSIMHVNIDAPFKDFDTAWKMLNYVADAGVQYFAFNLRISACKHNHGFYGKTCPVCGEPMETTYQRIVGFLVPTKTYSKERKAEFAMRDWFDVVGDDLK